MASIDLEARALEAVLPVPARTLPRPESIIQSVLAKKTLHGWMQNRYQTRYPLVLNLKNLAPAQAALLLETLGRALAMVEADEATLKRAEAFIEGIGGTMAATATGQTMGEVSARIRTAKIVPQAYAACAGAIGRRTVAHRRFLDFLAAQLDLPDDVARSINRRFAN